MQQLTLHDKNKVLHTVMWASGQKHCCLHVFKADSTSQQCVQILDQHKMHNSSLLAQVYHCNHTSVFIRSRMRTIQTQQFCPYMLIARSGEFIFWL